LSAEGYHRNKNVNLDAMKVKICRDLTAAVTKPAPQVLFADPQQAINRSVYISDSKYGVPRTKNRTNKKK